MDRTFTRDRARSGDPAAATVAHPVGLRLAAIVLLLLAWFPALPLALVVGPWGGVVVGVPSAVCFGLAYRRTGARGNLLGAAAALATPLVWSGIFVALMGDASMS